jgi:hypothetical protein
MKDNFPTGSLVARLYSSNGDFASIDAYAETLIAQSTNTVNIADLSPTYSNVDFFFDDVTVSGGIYFIALFSGDINTDNGSVRIGTTDVPGEQFGYFTFWDPNNERWQPWSWD